MQTYKEPLNPDAFGTWGQENSDDRSRIVQATSSILKEKIQEVIAEMKKSNAETNVTVFIYPFLSHSF